MKKTIIIIASLLITAFCLIGCEREEQVLLQGKGENTEHEGVLVSLEKITEQKGDRILYVKWKNGTEEKISIGNWFVIEYLDTDGYKDVSILDPDFYGETTELLAGQIAKKTYTTAFADLSAEGVYRLKTKFYLTEQNGSVKGCYAYVEFEIKKKSDLKSYSLTAIDGDRYLYEPMKKSYKEGERVTVKTFIVCDADIEVYVNGKSIGSFDEAVKVDGRYAYWEYSFIMPSEDVVITFDTAGGM